MNITPHLTSSEYVCKCCARFPIDFDVNRPCYSRLFRAFENLREKWGKPLVINSGYRCVARNKAVGGEDWSAHVFGLALDIQFGSAQEVDDFVKLVKREEPELRCGWALYRKQGANVVHLDTGHMVNPRPTPNYVKGATW